MEKMTIDQARERFDDLISAVRTTKQPIVVTGPNGDLVKVVPIPEPAYYYKGRPVYTKAQLAQMESAYRSEPEWLKDIEEKEGK